MIHGFDMLAMDICVAADSALRAHLRMDWPPHVEYMSYFKPCVLVPEHIVVHFQRAESPSAIDPGRFILTVDNSRLEIGAFRQASDKQWMETVSNGTRLLRHTLQSRGYLGHEADEVVVSLQRRVGNYFKRFVRDWYTLCEQSTERNLHQVDSILDLDMDSVRTMLRDTQVRCALLTDQPTYYLSYLVDKVHLTLHTLSSMAEHIESCRDVETYRLLYSELGILLDHLLAIASTEARLMVRSTGIRYSFDSVVILQNIIIDVSRVSGTQRWTLLNDIPSFLEWLRDPHRNDGDSLSPIEDSTWYTMELTRFFDGDIQHLVRLINRIVRTPPQFCGFVMYSGDIVLYYPLQEGGDSV